MKRVPAAALTASLLLCGPSLSYAKTKLALLDIKESERLLRDRELKKLTTELRAQLNASDDFECLPLGEVRAAVASYQSEQGTCDAQCMRRVGRRLLADKVLSAEIRRFNTKCTTSAVLFDVSSDVEDVTSRHETGCSQAALVGGLKAVVDDITTPDDPLIRFRLDLGLLGGLGGDITLTPAEDGDEPTLGIEAAAMFLVGRYFSAGPLVRFSRRAVSNIVLDSVSSIGIDIALAGRLPAGAFEFYLGGAVGLEVAFLSIEDACSLQSARCDASTGLGWNAGFKAGVRYSVNDTISIFADGGLLWQRIDATISNETSESPLDIQLENRGVVTLGVGFGG